MKEVQSYQAKQIGNVMLNANELSCNVSEDIRKEIQAIIPSIAFNRYPDADNEELIQAYAKVMNLDFDRILAGNGSDEMLGLMIGYFLGKDKVLFTLQPDFSMYDYYATMHEASIEKFPCGVDGSFDVQAFIEEGKAKRANMILFSNPNNPTGHILTKTEVQAILTAFPAIPVIVDEAYGEFAQESMVDAVDQYPNLYVTRTLSKAYGLAGARLGFLISNKANIATLKPNVVPYNINTISQKVGVIVLQHASEFQQMVQDTIAKRDAFYDRVKSLKGITCYPSHANYVFARSQNKAVYLKAFEEKGIVIRDYAKDDSLRITIGSEEENALVLEVLTQLEEDNA